MPQAGKILPIVVRCLKCGKTGKPFIVYRSGRGIECYIYHYYNSSYSRCCVSCLKLKEMGINIDEVARELKQRLKEKLKHHTYGKT